MKQLNIKAERVIDGHKFYIRAFPAFKAAKMTGELASLLTPLLGSLSPMLKGGGVETNANFMDIDAADVAPLLANGASYLSGDKVEKTLKMLLVQYGNVSYELLKGGEAQTLTEDDANEIFCGDVQGLFILAFEVVKANFSGFFKKTDGRFGKAITDLTKKLSEASTEN